jgi:cation-transporting ATPase E
MCDAGNAREGKGGQQQMSTAVAPTGLSAAEVAERVAAGQVNDVPAAPTRTVAEIVRANALTQFNLLLGSLLVVILVVGPPQDALFGLVLVANTLVGIVQEVRAKRTLERLAVVSAPSARVVRDGRAREVAVGEVVLGDLLRAGAGAQLVVDGEVVEAAGAEVDESLLTGESEPVGKRPGDQVLSGSFVVAGTLAYRATRVGREAYAARLAEEARRFTLVRSELRAAVDRIVTFVTWLLVPTAVLLVASQLRSQGVQAALRGAVAGTVHMVPEGLVLLVSVAFAVGVVRLGRRQVLVQELPAVEILARASVIEPHLSMLPLLACRTPSRRRSTAASRGLATVSCSASSARSRRAAGLWSGSAGRFPTSTSTTISAPTTSGAGRATRRCWPTSGPAGRGPSSPGPLTV